MSVAWQARWIVPLSGPVISPGVVTVGDDGRIVSIEEKEDRDATPLGDVAIVPGLINTHTHLEFSGLSQPLVSGKTFARWIPEVIAARRGRNGHVAELIERGWQETLTGGAVAVGEIATDDPVLAELHARGARGVVFRELLGLSDEAATPGLETARAHLETGGRLGLSRLTAGLSPHAPYSVHPDLLTGLIDLAAESGAPLAMHLAESPEELELLAHGTGELVQMLRELGVWRPGLLRERRRPLDYLQALSRAPQVLVVHGNYLEEDEIEFLAERPQFSVAYCPRTHAAFGHRPHPWRTMLDRGVRVGVGTDSRATNPDLSLHEELKFLAAAAPDIPAGTLLRMATADAAEALGLADYPYTLSRGEAALFTVIEPAGPISENDLSGLFAPGSRVRGVLGRA